jgi:hypothetical protein
LDGSSSLGRLFRGQCGGQWIVYVVSNPRPMQTRRKYRPAAIPTPVTGRQTAIQVVSPSQDIFFQGIKMTRMVPKMVINGSLP